MQTLFTFYKTSYLNKEVNCTDNSLQLVLPGTDIASLGRRETGLERTVDQLKFTGQSQDRVFTTSSHNMRGTCLLPSIEKLHNYELKTLAQNNF
jgi:hypothetical protein